MKIKSVNQDSILKNHLYLSKIIFGKDSKAVKYLESQVRKYGEEYSVNVEEREYFAFLKKLHSEE